MRRIAIVLLLVVVGSTACAAAAPDSVLARSSRFDAATALPAPEDNGTISLEQALASRRSQRTFGDQISEAELGQLFWAAQGETDAAGHRTSPSAGALYPLEFYALSATTFDHYLPAGHRIERRPDTSTKDSLAEDAFGQDFVAEAPTVIVVSGVVARTEAKYGAVAHDLMNREAGHAVQNLLLQATALDLVAVPVGGFEPAEIARSLALPPGEEVLYLIPVARPATG